VRNEILKNVRKLRFGQCELCQRKTDLTFHHLIPRKVHRRKSFSKRYSRDELQQGANICRPCHKAIHKFHDETHIARNLETVEKLRADEKISNYLIWIRKQKLAD